MKAVGLGIAGLLTPFNQGYGYPPGETFPEELLVVPEFAVILMLGIRLIMLILGHPKTCKPFTASSQTCRGQGWSRVCTCA
jgi:hypothetical protein